MPFPFGLTVLAQDVDVGSILLWSFLLIALVVGMFLAVGWFKKWMKADEGEGESARIGFTLGDLRRMHEQGQITAEEFERARAQMIAATKRAAERDAQLAAEAAKERGASTGTVTDVDAIRRRAREHRATVTMAKGRLTVDWKVEPPPANAAQPPPPPPSDPPPAGERASEAPPSAPPPPVDPPPAAGGNNSPAADV